jgi:hypothetical protein
MSPLSARRILTALTLAILLCAAPVFAQAPARTERAVHGVTVPTQIGLLDALQNAITHFIAKITVSHPGSGPIAGPRMDPDGAPTGPGTPPPPAGTP